MRLQRPRKLQWLSLLLLLVNEVSGQLLSLLLLPALGIPNLTLCCAGNSSSLNHRCASRGSLPQSLLTACFVPKVSQWHVEAAACGSSQGSWVASGAIAAAGLLAGAWCSLDVAAANLSAADESSCCDAVAAVLLSLLFVRHKACICAKCE